MSKSFRRYGKRTLALVLAVLCVVGLLPHTVKAVDDTITLTDFGYSDAHFQSEALGSCAMNQMYFDLNGKTTTGFCGTKGGGMGTSLFGQTWGNPREITDPTVKTVMAYFYANLTGEHTEKAKSMGYNVKWTNYVAWYMGAWTQAVIWRYQEGSLDPNPAEACAEEFMAVLNSLDNRSFTSIDELYDGSSFRDRVQYILNMGAQGTWGDCTVYEYLFTGAGSSAHPKDTIQKVVIGEREISIDEVYVLTIKKVDADDPNKTLPGAMFHVESSDGSISVDGVTNADGTYTLKNLPADTYAITETAAPEGYEIDNAGPVYALVPGSDGSTTVTVTFKDSMEITGSGHIRKVDADDPSKGLGGAVIRITGVDNTYSGTFTTSADGSLSDVPWDDLPKGSYTAEEITPPEGYTLSTDPNKVKQAFTWDGKTDVNLVFEDDARVKIRLKKQDESGRPLVGALFNVFCDGQLVGSDTTDAAGTITVPNVTKGLYAFVEVSAPEGYNRMSEPVLAYVDQATVDGGGTVTVTAVNHQLPGLLIRKLDRATNVGLPGVTFRIWRNTALLGDYITDGRGEIALEGLEPGTYQVQEISSDDAHVLDGAPQQVELKDGGGSVTLTVFNDVKPGMRLLKLSQETMSPLSGARFCISKVSGGFTQEYTTDASGEIDLSNLDPGAYEVEEIAAPKGYLIDDARRVVELRAGVNTEIVYSDAKRPVLELVKLAAETGSPLAGATYRIGKADDPDHYVDKVTDAQGRITLEDLDAGLYTVREISAPAGYILDSAEHRIKLYPGETSRIVAQNQRKPGLVIEKRSKKDGSVLAGATFRIMPIGDAERFVDRTTDAEGRITLENMDPGMYAVREISAPEGYLVDPQVYNVKLTAGQVTTLSVVDEARPSLRIVKLDIESRTGLKDAVFEVYRDGKLLGTYTTDGNGEILLYDLDPGTYLVKEVSAPDSHVTDSTPQEIELVPEQTGTLIFLDHVKPGIHLVKLDSQTFEPLENARFRISQVGGNFSKEFTTDANGEIDLSGLEPGSYTVEELAAPDGYLIDDAQRIIKIEGGEYAQFVYTNTRRPKFVLEKYSLHDGKPLAGATYRIAPVDDPDHYVDKVTDEDGRITLEGLDAGVYSVYELSAPGGYILDGTEHHIRLYPGETSTLVVKNEKRPALRIVKLDIESRTGLKDAVFEVYRDSKLLGTYTTDGNGEILLYDLDPGTYLVKEVAAPDSHVTDSTPQEIELVPEQTGTLVFLDHVKPGIHLVKLDSQTFVPLKNVRFRISQVGGDFSREYTTDANGEIDLSGLEPGTYTVEELAAPDGYLIDDAQRIIRIEGGEKAQFVFTDSRKPSLKLTKTSSDGTPLEGVAFRLAKIEDGIHYIDRTTGPDGTITWEGLEPGVYSLVETATDDEHILDTREHHIELFPGKTSTIVLENQRRSNLTVHKTDADTGAAVPGTVFLVKTADGHSVQEVTTGPDGTATVENLLPGVYEVSEKSVPAPYLLDAESQLVTLYPNRDRDVYFENHKKPSIEIIKENSITHERLSNVRFQVWYASNDTETGEYNDLGVFTTDENGRIVLDGTANGLRDGWFRVKELEPPHGFAFKGSDTQEAFIPAGKGHTFLFQNVPLSALVAYKYDSISKAAIEGCLFELRCLGGDVSGSGGTVIGRYRTGANGSFTVTGLKAGYYICEEVESDGDHVIDSAPQSFYISGKDQDVVTLYFNNSPKGSVLVRKVSASDGSPLSDVEFLVTTSKGTVVGNANGKYVTDSSGSFLVEGIDPGTSLVIKETRAKPGYLLDDTAQTVEIKAGVTVTLEFRDKPEGGLIVHKLSSTDRKTPLEGVQFKITYADGSFVDNKGGQLSSNGLYFTDENGQIVLDGVTGTLIVTEVQTIPGYTIDPAKQSQTVVINPDDTQELWFYNEPTTTLVLEKYIEGTTTPLKGVTFLVTDSSGASVGNSNGEYITDENGRIVINDLTPGTTITAKEIKTLDGFVLDTAPKSILIKSGEVNTLRFYNKSKGTFVLLKKDSVTKLPVYGAKFQLTYADGSFVDYDNGHLSSKGLYTTDENGEIRVYGVVGTIVAKELEAAPGYVIDPKTQTQTVVVGPDDTQTLVAYNEPLCSLTITKLDSQTHKPVPNTEFTVTDGNGSLIGRYVTGEDGTVTVTGLVPGTTVVVRESKVPRGYVLDTTPKTIIVRNGSNSVTTGDGSGGTTGAGTGNDLYFENDRTVSLVLEKFIEGTTTPIKGVTFLVTDSGGAAIGNSNGEYITDENGRVVINDLTPGTTVVARETKVPDGFVLDTTPKSILLKSGEANTLRFYNKAAGTLVVSKLDKEDKSPLAGVEFEITYSDGSYVDADYGHLSSKGLYKTDANGEIRIPGVVGTVIVTETKPLEGYTMDEGTRTQTVQVNPGDTQTIVVYNTRVKGLTIVKSDKKDKTRIAGVKMEVRKLNGEIVGQFTTDKNGTIYLPEAESGWYEVVELEAASGYKLDATPHRVEVKDGEGGFLEVTNERASSALIHKVDSVTGQGIYGVTFLLSDAKGNPVGTYQSDNNGYVYIDKELADGKYTIREIECAEGYTLDTQPKTIYVEYGGCATITWKNTPVTGQIQITKTSADYNSNNGWAAGTPIPGTEFEIYNRAGNLVDTVRTDKNGVAKTRPLPLGRYKVVESKAASFYALDKTPIEVEIEFAGQIVKAAMTNKSLLTNVSITKRGYSEVMPGQTIRYDFSGIANNSTVSLESFYFRDTLPTGALRLDKIVTGTWSAQGNYKIVYKTNFSAEYRLLADNLSTAKSYTLAASPTALGLASNEYVTEFMYVFGIVPSGFRQVEAPKVYCTVLSNLANGVQFTNVADVGGVYNDQWVMAVDRWVTAVYTPTDPTPLPRTGY